MNGDARQQGIALRAGAGLKQTFQAAHCKRAISGGCVKGTATALRLLKGAEDVVEECAQCWAVSPSQTVA